MSALALDLLAAYGLRPTVESVLSLLVLVAGFAGVWLHATHPPPAEEEWDTALMAMLVF